jgi:hypothetical protein
LVSYSGPTLNGERPKEQYYLDNPEHLKALGLNPQDKGEKADKYVHYPQCDWAVVEWKGSAIPKAIRQIEHTVEKLDKANKPIHLLIIIKKRINRFEQKFFKRRRDKVLIDPQTQEPIPVRVGNQTMPIILLYHSEQHTENLIKYISGGKK